MASELELDFKRRWEEKFPDIRLRHDDVDCSRLITTWEEYWRWRKQNEAARAKRYRADFLHLESQVLIEIHGGVEAGLGHNTKKGVIRDSTKLSLAAQDGWLCFVLAGQEMILSEDWMNRIGQTIYARLREREEVNHLYIHVQDLEDDLRQAKAAQAALEEKLAALKTQGLPTTEDGVAWALKAGGL